MATALFKPRILAKYLADKMYYPIMFLVLMLLISIAPFSLALKNGYAILPNEYDLIKEAISSTAGEVKIEAGKMTKSNDYMLKTQYFIYTFDSPNLSLMSTVVNITASDISSDALEVALSNAKKNNADINFVNTDIYKGINKKFDCITSAEEELGVNINCIVGACKGRQKTAGGFHWRYADEND